DPSSADDHDAAALAEGGLDRLGIGDAAQGVYSGQVHARDGQTAWRGAGGEYEVGVGRGLARGEGDGGPGRVDSGGGVVESCLDAMGVVVGLVVDVDRIGLGIAQQYFLGQARALVGAFTFVADE